MTEGNVVFVLGAGASKEFGLPLGTELRAKIKGETDFLREDIEQQGLVGYRTNPKVTFYDQLASTKQYDKDELYAAARSINNGIEFSHSIDEFIYKRADNKAVEYYGKALILKFILEGERTSHLFFKHINYSKEIFRRSDVQECWLMKLMRVLGEGITKESVNHIFDNVSFIVFNYDRCLEHFLAHALVSAYEIEENEAEEIVNKACILHPYGYLGPLKGNDKHAAVPYGNDWSESHTQYIENIRVYSEDNNEDERISSIKEEISKASSVFFLGFGFHHQNMSLLTPITSECTFKNAYCTAYNISKPNQDEIIESIKEMACGASPQNKNESDIVVNIVDGKTGCKDFIDHYSLVISRLLREQREKNN